MTTIGWIGTGNMASAIIRGITQKTQDYTMAAYSPNLAKKTDFPAQKLISAAEVAKTSDILFLAVKPYKMAEVLEEIKDVLKPETLVVSIAVSLTLVWYAQRLGPVSYTHLDVYKRQTRHCVITVGIWQRRNPFRRSN